MTKLKLRYKKSMIYKNYKIFLSKNHSKNISFYFSNVIADETIAKFLNGLIFKMNY
jgi:hypothetical protein